MKIFYYPCHSSLMASEVSLLKELRYEIIVGKLDEPPDLTCDLYIIVHRLHWLENFHHLIKHKPILFRTIGQSHLGMEIALKKYTKSGINIVRCSPCEVNIPQYAGGSVIRFYKDPNIWKGYTGEIKRVCGFSKKVLKRPKHVKFQEFLQITDGFARVLYGKGNEDLNQGVIRHQEVPSSELVRTLKQNRCMLYTGTFPASYTLGFIECLMIGIPIVAIGPELFYKGFDTKYYGTTYEIHQLLPKELCSDSILGLRQIIKNLLNKPDLAQDLSKICRNIAIKHFSKEKIKKHWIQLLDSYT